MNSVSVYRGVMLKSGTDVLLKVVESDNISEMGGQKYKVVLEDIL